MSDNEIPESMPSRINSDLRREAEKRFHDRHVTPDESLAEMDMRAMLHELQVHQIELEMQNEELHRAHTALQELSDSYQDLFDFAPIGYFRLDEEQRILELNLAGASLLGLDRAAAVRQRFEQYVAPVARERFAQFAAEVFAAGRRQTCEVELRKGRETVWAVLEGAAASDRDGTSFLRLIATDVTQRKDAEIQLAATLDDLRETQDELVRTQRLAMLGQLAGSVAHEVRTPLSVIQNSVFFLEGTLPTGDQTTHQVLAEIKRAVGKSDRIITAMLDYVREPSPERTVFPVSDAVSRALSKVSLPDSIRLLRQLTTEGDQIKVEANLDQITRILVNLIENAVQAMPRGGELAIGASREEGNAVCIELRDTGCGIPAGNLQKIFEPLFSTKTTGIGLGLPIAQRYAQLNNGCVSVESDVGRGSTFRLVLKQSTAY